MDAAPVGTAERTRPLDALVAWATPTLEPLQTVTQAYQEEMPRCEVKLRKRETDIAERRRHRAPSRRVQRRNCGQPGRRSE